MVILIKLHWLNLEEMAYTLVVHAVIFIKHFCENSKQRRGLGLVNRNRLGLLLIYCVKLVKLKQNFKTVVDLNVFKSTFTV